MAVLNIFIGFLIGYSFLVTSSECTEDVCVKRTPCTCVFSNGTGIDLTLVATSTFYNAVYYENKNGNLEYKLSTYYFHPCADVPTNRPNGPGDTCDKPLSLFREEITMKMENSTSKLYKLDSSVCNYLGNVISLNFSNDGRAIIYHNPPSKTTVLLSCASGADKLHVTSLDEPDDLLLTFYSESACLRQVEEPGRSFGSTLLIIFFSCVIFYLVLGVCTKKFLMGATGIEVIPNLGFWTDLPNLVKDGWAFAISGFRLPSRGPGVASPPDPNSYDSI